MSSLLKFDDGSTIPMIKQYLRNDTNQKNGLMVCIFNEDQDSAVIGWSRCSHNDTFNSYRAHEIAVDRALLGDSGRNVPYAILFDVFEFMSRCRRYFKDKDIYVAGVLPMTEEEFKRSDLYYRAVKKSRALYDKTHASVITKQ